MENASKALLMAGGVLIALLVISLVVLAFTQMSDYQKSQSDLVKTGQLAEFNEQFVQYVRDDINGIDLVTLANKVVSFNQKESGPGEINYEQKITLEIDMNEYQKKYSGKLFNKTTYKIEDKNDTFFTIINQYTDLEKTYTLKTIVALSSNIESLKKYYIEGDQQNGKSVSDVTGTKVKAGSDLAILENELINNNFDKIEKYSEYTEFKSAEFKGLSPEYINGQISKLKFKYIGN